MQGICADGIVGKDAGDKVELISDMNQFHQTLVQADDCQPAKGDKKDQTEGNEESPSTTAENDNFEQAKDETQEAGANENNEPVNGGGSAEKVEEDAKKENGEGEGAENGEGSRLPRDAAADENKKKKERNFLKEERSSFEGFIRIMPFPSLFPYRWATSWVASGLREVSPPKKKRHGRG